MKITSIRQGVVPISSSIANAYIDFSKMTASVVAVTVESGDGRSATGYGFNSNGRYAQPGLLAERFIPRLEAVGELPAHADGGFDPIPAWTAMMKNEKPGGHGDRSVAVGVLDMALWDAAAKLAQVPLWKLLADRYNQGRADEQAWIYAAGGYYQPGKDVDALVEEMKRYLGLGYSVVKMKIGGSPGMGLREALLLDLQRIEAVLKLLDGQGHRLCVDVNGRFGLHAALSYGAAIQGFGLRWYEEPLDPLDYSTHATLAEHYAPPLATGENLFSMLDARNLIRHGGLRPDRDVLQFDPALSYGLVEYLRTLEMLREHGWSPRRCVPHGGHQFALNIAVGLGLGGNESYPEVFAPFGGFADSTPVENSRIRMPDIPGIGFEAKSDLHAVLRDL
ncbi:enolase C-terminal domain-like protein [Roseococcus suduntuyensis]|uniref:L-alanine-DL-glutamate epimerase-like enolase superfamily enzyme n=1 Tax=Roseococcus suduntuyensis TaxID=455361 RepID=A0A840AIR2_9PROT|nr:enolase C-terminal domain-like protein [Roseococcus suduntuyensis]MBB3900350.1 L-alanine-DL-glutamate epimerase-like enolase superfamily enzyme [Roseococcus suduntuyensis]